MIYSKNSLGNGNNTDACDLYNNTDKYHPNFHNTSWCRPCLLYCRSHVVIILISLDCQLVQLLFAISAYRTWGRVRYTTTWLTHYLYIFIYFLMIIFWLMMGKVRRIFINNFIEFTLQSISSLYNTYCIALNSFWFFISSWLYYKWIPNYRFTITRTSHITISSKIFWMLSNIFVIFF